MQKLLLAAPGAAMLTRRDALASHPDRRAQLIQIVALQTGPGRPRRLARRCLGRSNGQTDGHITKLKLVRPQMYGRAKLDLLRARLLGAA
jgi:hypothetical protein